eukprot:scaffold160339_cov32-Tisochrysis_lutea.AAC.3
MQALTTREAEPRVEIDPILLDLLEVDTTVEHGLMVPAPGALPDRAWIELEGVKCRHQRAQPAERRLILRAESRGHRPVALHGSSSDCLLGELLTAGGGKRDRRRRGGEGRVLTASPLATPCAPSRAAAAVMSAPRHQRIRRPDGSPLHSLYSICSPFPVRT